MSVTDLFGEGDELTALQMSLRAMVVFMIALALLRISGRRSFGMKRPFDNVILVLLGAILSRAIIGTSPFIATVCASFVLVIMHRFFAIIGIYNDTFGKVVKVEFITLYKDGQLIHQHLKKCNISEKDLLECIRLNSGIDALYKIKLACMERNGDISVIPLK